MNECPKKLKLKECSLAYHTRIKELTVKQKELNDEKYAVNIEFLQEMKNIRSES